MKFTKMQGLGNDYIYVNGFAEQIADPPETARMVSDRHFGAGSDGLVLICPSDQADFRMRMYNADGSEAEMCGNAARCIGKYVYERGLTNRTELTLETGSGIRPLSLTVRDGKVVSVRVDMGIPALQPEKIPVRIAGDRVIAAPIEAEGETFAMTCVSMGNPHAVIFVPDAERFDVARFGTALENHPVFPARANIEVATVRNRGEIRMRVWERGSGETMACGTGACATLVAAVLNGLCDREAVLALNGGKLKILWDETTDHVYQEGPASFVFDGEWIGNG